MNATTMSSLDAVPRPASLPGRLARTLAASRERLADLVLPMYAGHPVTTRGIDRV